MTLLAFRGVISHIGRMLKIVTWNVNSISSRLERLIAFLKRHDPDIVAVQELKCTEEKFPFQALRDCGYFAAAFGQKTYNGVALLSKTEPSDVVRGFFGGTFEDDAARLIGARFGSLRVLSVYCPNGQAVGTDKYEYKLNWYSEFREFLNRQYRSEQDLCIGGDFNVAPEDRDVHDPEAWRGKVLFSEPEKKALSELCEYGLVDTFRQHHTEGGFYSWWDYRQLAFPFNKGLRIDFLLATPSLAKRCRESFIDREERKGEKPSDHAPVLALFE